MAVKPLQRLVVALELLFQNGPGAGARLPVDDGGGEQLWQAHLAATEGVDFVADPHKGLLAEQLPFKVSFAKVPLHHRKVQLAVVQHLEEVFRVVHNEGEGVVLAGEEAVDPVVDDVIPDGLGGPHLQLQYVLIGEFAPHLQVVVLHRAGVLLQRPPLWGLNQLPPSVGKQAAPVLMLQKLNVMGDGRLRKMQNLGGFAVIHLLTQDEEGFHSIV